MKCMKAILAAINPTYVVEKIRPDKKIKARTEFEPMTGINKITSSQLACQISW